MSEAPSVVIVGGGLAGISAAVQALAYGWRPILVEARARLGGRTQSFSTRNTPFTFDNGQHAILGSYQHTFWLLKQLGTFNQIHLQKRLQIHFQLGNGCKVRLAAWRLPAPWHLLLPLLGRSPNKREALLALWRFSRSMHQASLPLKAEGDIPVEPWLQQTHQSAWLKQMLWEPLTLAALNTSPSLASSGLLLSVLREGLLKSARQGALGWPTVPLSDLISRSALNLLRKHRGRIFLRQAAQSLVVENGRVTAVRLRNGQKLAGDIFILATPPQISAKLIEQITPGDQLGWFALGHHPWSAITTLYFWTRKPLPVPLPMAFVHRDFPFHWLFPHPVEQTSDAFGYAAVISANGVLPPDAPTIFQEGWEHLFGLPSLRRYQMLHWQLVEEKRATLQQDPLFQRRRPGSRTQWPNLFLAGDWIQTGLPMTMESAVLSGRMAVWEAANLWRSGPSTRADHKIDSPGPCIREAHF